MQKTGSSTVREYWRSAAAHLKHVPSITGAGLLAALGVVLKGMFTIPLATLSRISFTFLATGLSGFLYGPLVSGLAAVIVDILGYLIRADGAYFFGYTLSAFVSGFIYGCWFYRQPVRLWRVFAATVTWMAVVSFCLNPLWMVLLNGEAFVALIWGRLLKNLVLLPVQTSLLYLMLKVTERQNFRLIKTSR